MRSLHSDWSALEFLPALYKLQELLSWQLIYSSPLNLMNVHPTCVHLVFSSRLNLCGFLELFFYTATSALVVCLTNSSCLRLSEFDLCLLSFVGLPCSSGTPTSLYLFQKIPPGRKMELSSKIHITCCPCLGDPSPVLLVVRCLEDTNFMYFVQVSSCL